jgi:putative hemolysin
LEPEQISSLAVLACVLLIQGLLSGARWALFSLDDEELEKIGLGNDARSRLLRRLLRSPRQTSLSLLLSRRVFLLGCVVAGWWGWRSVGGSDGVTVVLLGLPLLVILSHAVISSPTFRQSPSSYVHRLAVPLWLLQHAVDPLRWSLQKTTEILVSCLSGRSAQQDQDAMERQYLGLVEVGHREGVVESEERRLIHRVFEFGDRPVSKVMTPRTEMFSLPLEMDLAQVIQRVKDAGYSRVPVYRKGKDEVVGILYAKDLLRLRLPGRDPHPAVLQDLLHEPCFVATHMAIDELFRDFQRRKLHVALCVDEYGGIAGLVTMEDLLEELFGEIFDEYDLDTRQWEPLGAGVYLVSGGMDLAELGDLLGIPFRMTEAHTVAGAIMGQLGRFPKRGEQVEADGVRFVVEKLSGTRIHAVRVERIPETEP